MSGQSESEARTLVSLLIASREGPSATSAERTIGVVGS